MESSTERPRLDSIDLLRGAVMVLMALDHARDYFYDARIVVEHSSDPGAVLFLTRWVTHFCAPVFVLLAGVSVSLWRTRSDAVRSAWQTSRYLMSRGLWLVALEWTLVHFAWFGLWRQALVFQVIGAIGVAMIAHSILVHLPWRAVLAVGLVILFGHNLLDRFDAENPYGDAPWWQVFFHQEGLFQIPSWVQRDDPFNFILVKYPVLPWIGVMATGYGLGAAFRSSSRTRWLILVGAGVASCIGFVALRWSGVYGDPIPFQEQTDGGTPWIRFLNVEKYPPSLLYLLMTLGPALLALALAERFQAGRTVVGRWLLTFGRVPLFFYLAHVMLLRLASEAWYSRDGGEAPNFLTDNLNEVARYGELPLWATYAAWTATLALLWLPCRLYGRLKRRSKHPILTYL